jgi:hypothetical protein
MSDEELAQERSLQHEQTGPGGDATTAARGSFGIKGTLAWLGVGIPFLIGVWIAIAKGAALF